MVTSWVHAAARFGFKLRLACPEALSPSPRILDWARGEGADITLTTSAEEAVSGAHAVNADTWVSMGDENCEQRLALLAPYQVDERLMSLAAGDAIFLHCLPAYREKEVTTAVIDGPQSAVWDEAENRLHAQKGILVWCMS
jgi:ornithine carbamoyltransferase